ncbi:MAG: hypothetical protein JWR58_4477 [Pseudonocardia sp.]|nr:hypothetical protein [Pseudonocardia sp.]
MSRSHRQSGSAGAPSTATVSVTCVSDGRAHAVPDSELAKGAAQPEGYYSAVCGHIVAAAPMAAPDGEPCALCAEMWDLRNGRRQRDRSRRIFG